MSSLVPEQLVVAQKAALEATFGFLTKVFEGSQKVTELNLQAVESAIADNHDVIAKAFTAKDAQELYALQTRQVQTAADKAQSYWRHVYEIISAIRAEFAEDAEAQLKAYQHNSQAFFDDFSKGAPAGYETAVATWKSFVKTANEASSATYEAAKKATQQVVAVAESNVSAASSASTRRTRQAVVVVDAVEKQ
ncbi:phasin family protein [Paraburkholderia sp. IMGN_8]|uniref:phasin family protein n=1 Tax=Paraburkholderia sp. IMGN_8 TaxID=3136564 RepID=UPI003101B1B8